MEYLYINTYVANNTLVVKSIRADEVKSYIQTVISNHRHKYTNHIGEKDIVGVVNVTRFRMVRQCGKVWDQLVSSDTIWLVTVREWDYYTREVLRPKDANYRLGKLIVERYPGALSAAKLKDFINYFFPDGQLLSIVLPNYSTPGPRSPVPEGLKSPLNTIHSPPVKRPDAMTVSAAKKLHLLDASKNRRHPLEYPHLHHTTLKSSSAEGLEGPSDLEDDPDEAMPREALRFDGDGTVEPSYAFGGVPISFSEQHAHRVEAINQHLEQLQSKPLSAPPTSSSAAPHPSAPLSLLDLDSRGDLSPQQALKKRMALDTASFTSRGLDLGTDPEKDHSPPPPPPPVVVAVDLAALAEKLSPGKKSPGRDDSPSSSRGGTGPKSTTSSNRRRARKKKQQSQQNQHDQQQGTPSHNDESRPLQIDPVMDVEPVHIPTGDFPLSPSAMILEENASNLDSLISEVKTLKSLLSAKGKDRQSILSLLVGPAIADPGAEIAAEETVTPSMQLTSTLIAEEVGINDHGSDEKSSSEVLPSIDQHAQMSMDEMNFDPVTIEVEPTYVEEEVVERVLDNDTIPESVANDDVEDTDVAIEDARISDISQQSEGDLAEWVPFVGESPEKDTHAFHDTTTTLRYEDQPEAESSEIKETSFVPFEVAVEGGMHSDSEDEEEEEEVTVYSEVDGPTPGQSFLSEDAEYIASVIATVREENQASQSPMKTSAEGRDERSKSEDSDNVSELAEEDPVDVFPISNEKEDDNVEDNAADTGEVEEEQYEDDFDDETDIVNPVVQQLVNVVVESPESIADEQEEDNAKSTSDTSSSSSHHSAYDSPSESDTSSVAEKESSPLPSGRVKSFTQEESSADSDDESNVVDDEERVVETSDSGDEASKEAMDVSSIHFGDSDFESENQPTKTRTPTTPQEDAELRGQLAKQAAALEEVSREKAALEAKLEETRQLLQQIAAGGITGGSGANVETIASLLGLTLPGVAAPPPSAVATATTGDNSVDVSLDELEAAVAGVSPRNILKEASSEQITQLHKNLKASQIKRPPEGATAALDSDDSDDNINHLHLELQPRPSGPLRRKSAPYSAYAIKKEGKRLTSTNQDSSADESPARSKVDAEKSNLAIEMPRSAGSHSSARSMEPTTPLSPFPPLPPPVTSSEVSVPVSTESDGGVPLVRGSTLASDSISDELHSSPEKGIVVPAVVSAPVVPNKATVLVNKIHKKIRRHTVAVSTERDPPSLTTATVGPASLETESTFSPVYDPAQGQKGTSPEPDRVRADSDISFASIASKDINYIRTANRRQGALLARSLEKKIIDEVAREMNATHDIEGLKTYSEEGGEERTSPLVVSVRKPLHQSSLLQTPTISGSSPRAHEDIAYAPPPPALTMAAVAALMPDSLSLPQEDEYGTASSNRKFTVDELSVSSSVLKSPKVIQITESLYEPAGVVKEHTAEPVDPPTPEEELVEPDEELHQQLPSAPSPLPVQETDHEDNRSESSLPSMVSSEVLGVSSPVDNVPVVGGIPAPVMSNMNLSNPQTNSKKYSQWEPPYINTNFDLTPPPHNDDPLYSLMQYHKPFLITEKYLENPGLKGHQARYQIINSISERELLFFVLFQLFGTVDGVLVKNIKMTQVSRLLKDLELASILASHLDTLLVKSLTLPPRGGSVLLKPNSTKNSVSSASERDKKVMMKTGTYSKVHNKAVEHGAATHLPTFQMYFNLLHCVAHQLTPPSKGKQLPPFGSQDYEVLVEKNMKVIEGKVRSWLLKTHAHQYDQLYAESRHSLSGILLRTMYRRFAHPTFQHHNGPSVSAPDTMHQSNHSAESSVTMSPPRENRGSVVSTVAGGISPVDGSEEHDAEMTRHVWERNTEQIRQIFNFYASTLEVRRLGHGVNKLYMSIENCKEMLIDFQVIPGIINAQDFTRLFRACKLWEWHIAEHLLMSEQSMGSAVRSPLTADEQSVNHDSLLHHQHHPHQTTPHTPHTQPSVDALGNVLNFEDPYDFKGTIGNLSLSLVGYMELLTRIAFNHHKLGNHTYESLENLMHLMDASNGKSKIIGTLRKSVSIRHFVYGSSSSHHHHHHHQK